MNNQHYRYDLFKKCLLKNYFRNCESITPGQFVTGPILKWVDPGLPLNRKNGMILSVMENDYVIVFWGD